MSQYEFGTEDSINYSSRDPYTSDHIPDKDTVEDNSFSRSSDQMPDLTSSANVIFNKELSGSESCNWYLLKKLGDNTSHFSSYKPSIHRSSAFFNGARIEGICCSFFYNQSIIWFLGVLENYDPASKDSIKRIICKFICVTILVVLFIFIIIIVSVVVSSGRTIFGSM